jgi:hypothetical protein
MIIHDANSEGDSKVLADKLNKHVEDNKNIGSHNVISLEAMISIC